MYLFFDTETTGLPKNWKAPVTDVNNWPRMVQLAWETYDVQGNLLARNNHIIKRSTRSGTLQCNLGSRELAQAQNSTFE